MYVMLRYAQIGAAGCVRLAEGLKRNGSVEHSIA